MRYIKKPIIIEAVQFNGINYQEIIDFLGDYFVSNYEWNTDKSSGLVIKTKEGMLSIRVSDWIVKGIQGEYYPCKDDIFNMTYKPFIQSESEHVL